MIYMEDDREKYMLKLKTIAEPIIASAVSGSP